MLRKSALYHDADISDTIATTQHNITTKQQITHFPCSGYGGDAIASYSLQIKPQHNNITTQQPPTAVYNEKLPFLLEEEELIWLFSSVILLLLFLRKPDELGNKPFFVNCLSLQRFYLFHRLFQYTNV